MKGMCEQGPEGQLEKTFREIKLHLLFGYTKDLIHTEN